jgi:hypothetical protein
MSNYTAKIENGQVTITNTNTNAAHTFNPEFIAVIDGSHGEDRILVDENGTCYAPSGLNNPKFDDLVIDGEMLYKEELPNMDEDYFLELDWSWL